MVLVKKDDLPEGYAIGDAVMVSNPDFEKDKHTGVIIDVDTWDSYVVVYVPELDRAEMIKKLNRLMGKSG